MSSAQDPPSDDDGPPAEVDSADGPVSEPPAATLSDIHSTLSVLVSVVEREHERATHREAIIDRLHEDNQLLRRGELQALHEPVRNALYRLHDMVKRESGRWSAQNPPTRHTPPRCCPPSPTRSPRHWPARASNASPSSRVTPSTLPGTDRSAANRSPIQGWTESSYPFSPMASKRASRSCGGQR